MPLEKPHASGNFLLARGHTAGVEPERWRAIGRVSHMTREQDAVEPRAGHCRLTVFQSGHAPLHRAGQEQRPRPRLGVGVGVGSGRPSINECPA